MSRENVEIVKRLYDAYERNDLTTAFSLMSEEIEWDSSRLQGSFVAFDPLYRGHDGVREFWRQWLTAWDQVTFSYDEFIDAGERVVVVLRQRARGRVSGLEVSQGAYAQLWTLRDEMLTRMEFFPTRREALRAAGLSE